MIVTLGAVSINAVGDEVAADDMNRTQDGESTYNMPRENIPIIIIFFFIPMCRFHRLWRGSTSRVRSRTMLKIAAIHAWR
jgi:hypothetical protein